VRGANLIVLSEHVDYWDDDGWRDPYSSHELTIRQSDYADRFRLSGPYTPQMVVDGDMEFVGSDEHRAIQAMEGEAKTNKLPVALSSIHLDSRNDVALHVEAGPFASSAPHAPAKIWIALADDYDKSSIGAGENAGATLSYVAVVRNLTEVGNIPSGGSFSRDVKISAENANHSNLRIIAVVQEASLGKVLGAASARLPN